MAEHQIGEFYTDLYSGSGGHDSPSQSRVNMLRRLKSSIEQLGRKAAILGIGAGRGEPEGMLLRNAHGGGNRLWQQLTRESLLVTVDIAEIPRRKLVNPKPRTHFQADSRQLPFKDSRFDIVTSNLSIDMLRRNEDGSYEQALNEMARVMRVGGRALLSFHSADLFDSLSRYYEDKDGIPAEYFNGNSSNNPFYGSELDIETDLETAGLSVGNIAIVKDGVDRWWEVDAEKQ